MSISFNQPASTEAIAFMEHLAGKSEYSDGKQFLYDKLAKITHSDMSELANKAQQPVTVEIHDEGEIKTMGDGTQYQVTRRGWVKLVSPTT